MSGRSGFERRSEPEIRRTVDLVETFALVREAARRRLGQRPYDEQIIAGIALPAGGWPRCRPARARPWPPWRPPFFDAFEGRGVHILTVNDYLARRDAAWMGPVYELLGVSVGCVQEGMPVAERRRRLRLRRDLPHGQGGGLRSPARRALSRARGSGAPPLPLRHRRRGRLHPHRRGAGAAGDRGRGGRRRWPASPVWPTSPASFARGEDYDTDEYSRNINLTEEGSHRVERSCSASTTSTPSRTWPCSPAFATRFTPRSSSTNDVDYIVRDGRAELVDELTGRVVDDRQWPDGLQAAIEAKEGLDLQPEGRILGSITMQHFMRTYPRLAGMTATAKPAADEFLDSYGLEVVVIPTHRPCIRDDQPDLLFTHREAKVRRAGGGDRRGPGDGSSDPGRYRAALPNRRSSQRSWSEAGVSCQVLNAKNDEAEAEIVAEAGAVGAVTISTNMAGRGTDIRLGGRDEADRDRVVALGGLYVIGTNRHESRRIDDQLRGRAGRQGDPGSSRFFVSLEDPLLERFGIRDLIPRASFPAATGTDAIDDPVIRREIARAQRVVDGQNRDTRTHPAAILGCHRRPATVRPGLASRGPGRDVSSGAAGRAGAESISRICRAGSAKTLLREIERRLTLLDDRPLLVRLPRRDGAGARRDPPRDPRRQAAVRGLPRTRA